MIAALTPALAQHVIEVLGVGAHRHSIDGIVYGTQVRQQHVKERQAFLLQKSAFLRPAAGTSNASNARGLGTAQWRETAGQRHTRVQQKEVSCWCGAGPLLTAAHDAA